MEEAPSSELPHWVNTGMLVAALLVIPVVVLDETHPGGTLSEIGAVLNWAIWTAFVAELLTLLSRAPDRGRWYGITRSTLHSSS